MANVAGPQTLQPTALVHEAWLRLVGNGNQHWDGRGHFFADVVRRHLDLVFATALRTVEDAGAAEEVSQNVFAALGRKAWQFAPDDSLPAWLQQIELFNPSQFFRLWKPQLIGWLVRLADRGLRL